MVTLVKQRLSQNGFVKTTVNYGFALSKQCTKNNMATKPQKKHG